MEKGMEARNAQVRGGGLAPSPRTMEQQRIERLSTPAPTTPVFENAPAAVIALSEAIKAIHFEYYGHMIDLFDLLSLTERQSEVLHRRGMKLLHGHLSAVELAIRSIMIKGEVPAELTAAAIRSQEKKPERQEESHVSSQHAGATADARV